MFMSSLRASVIEQQGSDETLVAGSPTLEESYLSKKGDDPRTDQVEKGADSELPGWQPKEKEA